MFFHVICFSVYNIFTNPHMTFLSKYHICMLSDSIIMYNVHMYLSMTVIFDPDIYSITIIFSIFLCFNSELSSATVLNTHILCHIYHFHKKFQYVVQLWLFILEISLTYLNTYLFLTVALHDM